MLAGTPAKRRCSVCHASYTRGESFCPLDGGAVVADETTTDELVGKTLDNRYLITRALGRGGMGKVYEADHVGLGKRVAVKLMLDDDRELRARFRQEARAASRIAHEHVVQIFDVGVDADRDYLVMEYIDGRDLDSVLRDGPLSVPRAVAIAQQILRGLHACHAAGVIHRDIKPSNIRLTNSADFVKIMDFGIAKSVRAEVAQTDTGTGRAIGTPQYMAPEQILDRPIDARTDIYAAGATLYAMLAGAPPFGSTSFTARMDAIAAPPPPIDSVRGGLAPSLVAAIARALDPDPARRFPDAIAFAEALGDGAAVAEARMEAATRPRGYATTAATGAATTGAATTGARPAPRRRWWPIVVALALLAAAAAGAYVYLNRATPKPAPVAIATPDAMPLVVATVALDADSPPAPPIDAAPIDAALIAAVLIDAAPIARKHRVAAPDAMPPAGTVIPQDNRPVCQCRVTTPQGLTSNACIRLAEQNRCTCEDSKHAQLCPFPITVIDEGKRKPDGARGGTMYCVDRTRSECDPLDKAMPSSCSVATKLGGIAGAACTGWVSGMKDTDAPRAGTYRCAVCDRSKTAPKFRGKTGDICIGHEVFTGEKLSGTLDCPSGP